MLNQGFMIIKKYLLLSPLKLLESVPAFNCVYDFLVPLRSTRSKCGKMVQFFLRSNILLRQGQGLFLARSMATNQRICALIIGAPGSGKGTISNWIVRDFGLTHVSSGDLLRSHIQQGSKVRPDCRCHSSFTVIKWPVLIFQVGKEAKSFIDRGDLVPDKVMVELISSEIKGLGDKNWLLDGFPRTIAQVIKRNFYQILLVIFISNIKCFRLRRSKRKLQLTW